MTETAKVRSDFVFYRRILAGAFLLLTALLVVAYFKLDSRITKSDNKINSLTIAITKDVAFDSQWYLSAYPDVGAAIQAGAIKSALDHYRRFGFLEGRFPSKPVVDETWYLQTYPDVAQAIREGRATSAYDHFMKFGYREGRLPAPPETKR